MKMNLILSSTQAKANCDSNTDMIVTCNKNRSLKILNIIMLSNLKLFALVLLQFTQSTLFKYVNIR